MDCDLRRSRPSVYRPKPDQKFWIPSSEEAAAARCPPVASPTRLRSAKLSQLSTDKLTGYADATKAFQALVRAYELCCKPDLRADDSDDSRDDSEDEREAVDDDD